MNTSAKPPSKRTLEPKNSLTPVVVKIKLAGPMDMEASLINTARKLVSFNALLADVMQIVQICGGK